MAGTVDSFDEDGFKAGLAAAVGVAPEDISVNVTAASINVVATIAVARHTASLNFRSIGGHRGSIFIGGGAPCDHIGVRLKLHCPQHHYGQRRRERRGEGGRLEQAHRPQGPPVLLQQEGAAQ